MAHELLEGPLRHRSRAGTASASVAHDGRSAVDSGAEAGGDAAAPDAAQAIGGGRALTEYRFRPGDDGRPVWVCYTDASRNVDTFFGAGGGYFHLSQTTDCLLSQMFRQALYNKQYRAGTRC
jgi:hypothetical protein